MDENQPDPHSIKPAEHSTAGTAPYLQVVDHYRSKILSGDLQPGDELPGRHELGRLHGTARVTTDKAIDVLSAEGLIVRRSRKPPVVADRAHHGTTLADRVAAKHATGEALGVDETSRILAVEMIRCPREIAPSLGVEPQEMVLQRSRVNFKSGTPATMSSSYYTQETVSVTPELTESSSLRGGSRELAAERLGSPLMRADEVVTSRLASETERKVLLLVGTYAVVTETFRVVLLENGRTVEAAVKVCPGDRPLRFTTNLGE